MSLPESLRTMVHYYNSRDHIFRSVTEYKEQDRAEVLDAIVDARSWYRERFSEDERDAYFRRRLAVEHMLREGFTARFGAPRQQCPAYLYLVPGATVETVEPELREIDAPDTRYLFVDLLDIEDRSNISFTIDDSLTSYRFILYEKQIVDEDPALETKRLGDHGKVFHIDELEAVYNKYRAEEHLYFEVQVWDRDVLQKFLP